MFLYSGSAAGGASHGGTGSGAPPARASKTTQISDKTTQKSEEKKLPRNQMKLPRRLSLPPNQIKVVINCHKLP